MRRQSIRLVVAVAIAGAVSWSVSSGCGQPSPEATPAQGSGHAERGARPGTWEDWCSEHGVPESQCTRCNRALIPAFKATNDWCAEHDLPESQCLQCNPSLRIERPAKRSGGR